MILKPGEITFNNRPEIILLDGNKYAYNYCPDCGKEIDQNE